MKFLGVLSLFLALSAHASAGFKAVWKLEFHDTYLDPSPQTLIQTLNQTISILDDADKTQVSIGGWPASLLYPLGKTSLEATGDFSFGIAEASLTGVKYYFRAWDRTGLAPGQEFRSTFEVEGRINVGEKQRLYFTQGDPSSSAGIFQYYVSIELLSLAPCIDATTCFAP